MKTSSLHSFLPLTPPRPPPHLPPRTLISSLSHQEREEGRISHENSHLPPSITCLHFLPLPLSSSSSFVSSRPCNQGGVVVVVVGEGGEFMKYTPILPRPPILFHSLLLFILFMYFFHFFIRAEEQRESARN